MAFSHLLRLTKTGVWPSLMAKLLRMKQIPLIPLWNPLGTMQGLPALI